MRCQYGWPGHLFVLGREAVAIAAYLEDGATERARACLLAMSVSARAGGIFGLAASAERAANASRSAPLSGAAAAELFTLADEFVVAFR